MLDKYVKLIDKRDSLIQQHCGENLRELLNFPQEREWYKNNIIKLDNKILELARILLPNEKFQKISDVYSNELLNNLYFQYKRDNALQK